MWVILQSTQRSASTNLNTQYEEMTEVQLNVNHIWLKPLIVKSWGCLTSLHLISMCSYFNRNIFHLNFSLEISSDVKGNCLREYREYNHFIENFRMWNLSCISLPLLRLLRITFSSIQINFVMLDVSDVCTGLQSNYNNRNVAEMSIIKYCKLILELHSKLTSHPKWAFEVAEKFYLKIYWICCWHLLLILTSILLVFNHSFSVR